MGKDLTVAVLMGGPGAEREVSFQSGRTIVDALQPAVRYVIEADLPDDEPILDDPGVDVFFPIIHGTYGEDGHLQGMLEERKRPFVGPGSTASRNAFNKHICKEMLREAGLPVAEHILVDDDADWDQVRERLGSLGETFVVKPICQGSSVGVDIVDEADMVIPSAKVCIDLYGPTMIEAFIPGRELTVGIVGGEALPIVEIVSRAKFYDYHAKYEDDETQFLFDTIDDKSLCEKISRTAKAAFEALECRHLSRVDIILGEDNTPYILEINTLPGFTSHSLLPLAAARAGMDQTELCARLVEMALETFGQEVR